MGLSASCASANSRSTPIRTHKLSGCSSSIRLRRRGRAGSTSAKSAMAMRSIARETAKHAAFGNMPREFFALEAYLYALSCAVTKPLAEDTPLTTSSDNHSLHDSLRRSRYPCTRTKHL